MVPPWLDKNTVKIVMNEIRYLSLYNIHIKYQVNIAAAVVSIHNMIDSFIINVATRIPSNKFIGQDVHI